MRIGAIPWQVWAGVAAVVSLLGFGQMRYNDGWNDAMAKVEKGQRDAAGRAQREADRVGSGDRSRVMQFDRD